MKRTIKNYIIFISLFILFQGCEFSERNSPMNKMNSQEIRQYFIDHKNDLEKIVKTCKNNPSIRFIDRTIEGSSFNNDNRYDFSKQSFETQYSVKDAIKIIKKIKLDNVHCGYFHHLTNSPVFIGVTFTIYSSGIITGGEGQSIIYDSKWLRTEYIKTHKVNRKFPEYKKLPQVGWYYTEYTSTP